jgi:hypothetical protein
VPLFNEMAGDRGADSSVGSGDEDAQGFTSR